MPHGTHLGSQVVHRLDLPLDPAIAGRLALLAALAGACFEIGKLLIDALVRLL